MHMALGLGCWLISFTCRLEGFRAVTQKQTLSLKIATHALLEAVQTLPSKTRKLLVSELVIQEHL